MKRSPLALLALVLCTAACQRPAQRLLHLGALVEMPPAKPVQLAKGVAAPGDPYQEDTLLQAPRIARLRVTARGTAPSATLAWKLTGDRNFPPFRALSIPLAADDQVHTYDIDLEREAYWNRPVEGLRLSVPAGRLEVLGITGQPAATLLRSMLLKGETRPALPGLAHLEAQLPQDLARGSLFESGIGLVPEFDRPGVRAVFRAYSQLPGEAKKLWLEETLDGSSGEGSGWHEVSHLLPAGAGRLILEVEASRNGAPLPEGAALWGDPLIVTPGRAQGRNLIVLLIDTLRADALGAYGDRSGITPNLDAFARRSIQFQELDAPSPWTLPSVSSLLTGLEPQTHGAGVRYGNENFAPSGLPGGVRTLASTLSQEGFYTAGVYHNIYVNPAFGLHQGFDEYTSIEASADVLVDRALDRLRHLSPDRRTFLYLHLFDLHTPYDPPPGDCQQVARRYAPGYHGPLGCTADRAPELHPIPPASDFRWIEGLYRAELAYTDRQVGRFLKGLKEIGLERNSVVAIVSDHGEEFWTRLDHERALSYETNSDHGHTFYQELLHVPALVHVPGRPAQVVRDPVRTVDLFPTLLHLSGVEPPLSQGTDLVPLLDGHPAERPTLLADVLLRGPSRWSVRRGRYKLIVPRDKALAVELYDLEADPGELHGLAASRPDLVASLRAWGEAEMAARRKARAQFLSGSDSLGATYLEWNHITKLRSLGYLK
ncbi:MAG TPA: sulfatase [Thermoanaerobaculia bacterium]